MEATEAAELTADERTVLVMAYRAESVGLPLILDCPAVTETGTVLVKKAAEALKARGLLYWVRETEDQPSGWCLTSGGRRTAGPLYDAHPTRVERHDNDAGKYGTVTTSGKQLHPGEPVFILRATDPHAAHVVRLYANRAGMGGAGVTHVRECSELADRIEAWQLANPTLVKKHPD